VAQAAVVISCVKPRKRLKLKNGKEKKKMDEKYRQCGAQTCGKWINVLPHARGEKRKIPRKKEVRQLSMGRKKWVVGGVCPTGIILQKKEGG